MAFLTRLKQAVGNFRGWVRRVVCPVIPGSVGSFVVGLSLAALFFVFREFVFPLSKVSGPWFCLMKTEQASNNTEGKFLGWRVLLAQSDRDITGSLEKIWDETASGRLLAGSIQQGTIEGFLRQNYLSTSTLSLHVHMERQEGTRETNASYDVKVIKDKNELQGEFYWTAGDAEGIIACQRQKIEWEGDRINDISGQFRNFERVFGKCHC